MSTRYAWRDVDPQNKALVDVDQRPEKPFLRLYTHDGCYCVSWPSEIDVPRFVGALESLDRQKLFVLADRPRFSKVAFTDERGRYDENFTTNEDLFRYLRENAGRIGRFLRVDVAGTSYARDFTPFKPTTVGAVNTNEVSPDNIFDLMKQTVKSFDESVISILRDAIRSPPPTTTSSDSE